MTNEEFCNFVGPAAYQIEAVRGYPMEALLTQVHLETGGLKAYPAGSNNVLGVKWNGYGEYVEAWTNEEVEGQMQPVLAKFQKYSSIVECLNGWANLMDKPWYKQARPYKSDWPAFLALIWFNGKERLYATDSLYLWKAVQRAADVGIPQWCATYREQQRSKPVTLVIDGQAYAGYRNVAGKAEGPLRPLLALLAQLGWGYHYDGAGHTLTVTKPKPWWGKLLP